MKIRVRFAPSPTGFLHVGNVRTALFNWLFARKQGGTFILRIEDTDAERSEIRFEKQLIEDLRWLGMTWDEGIEIGGDFGPYRQTQRLPIYREKAQTLVDQDKAYYCFCSPEELEVDRQKQKAAGKTIKYSGKCRAINSVEARSRVESGESATVRLKVRSGTVGFQDLIFGSLQVETKTIGDFIILRSDGTAQYNLAVVVDDSLMEITHVIRGEGHISNTHRQILINESLRIDPPQFAHLSTILGPDGSKLSKRHGATSIGEFREKGYLPQALLNYLALLGWTPAEGDPEILDPGSLISAFDFQNVNVSPAIFDLEKLNWVDRSHLRQLPVEELIERSLPFLKESGIVTDPASERHLEWLTELTSTLLKYVDKLEDLTKVTDFLTSFDPRTDLQSPEVQQVLAVRESRQVIRKFDEAVQSLPDGLFDFESYKDCVLGTRDQTGQKGKNLFRPIRVAITARASGPELDKLVPLIDQGSLFDLPRPIPGIRSRVAEVRQEMDRLFQDSRSAQGKSRE